MKTGTVRWFSMKKGYGFIEPDEGGGDVFVNITAVHGAGLNTLAEGQKLFYRIDTKRKGGVTVTAVQSDDNGTPAGIAS